MYWSTPDISCSNPTNNRGAAQLSEQKQTKKWYDEMLENTKPESRMEETTKTELQDTPHLENTKGVLENQNIYEDMDGQWDIPSPVQSPSEGRSLNGAQLNVQKLMSFLGMPTTTTMLIKLKGDPELAETLRSFLNDEIAVNLERFQEDTKPNEPNYEKPHDPPTKTPTRNHHHQSRR